MRTRRLVLVLGAALLAAAVAVSVAAAGSLTGNRRAARRDAPLLLAKLILPPGAIHLPTEPAGDNGYLKPMEALESDMAHVVARAWWQLPGTPAEAIAFIRAHPPAGPQLSSTGSLGNRNTGTSALSLSYQWRGVGEKLGQRELTVTTTALPNGQTGLLAEAQSDWIVPRPKSERIPSSTRLIQITTGTSGAKWTGFLSVTGAAKVDRIVGLINGLAIAQPIVYVCPPQTNPRLITMTFRASPDTRALAVLTYADYQPWSGPSEACKTVQLTVGGRRQDPLIGASFLKTIGRLLGTSLA
ncbi:MAG: hypothetical protein WAK93_19115 [Solirubrobacteraceae bacterium]